jgi:branched-subunit amino acid transport protein
LGIAAAAQGLKTMQYSLLELWLLIALLALLTLVSRSFFVLLPRRWQPRGRVEQALRYAPLAALLAITVPEVVKQLPTALHQAAPAWAIASDARLVSALVLAAVIRLTRHTLWGLAAGTVTFLVLRPLSA